MLNLGDISENHTTMSTTPPRAGTRAGNMTPPTLGNLDLPANPHSLFKVTLNSDELFNYLRRLGDEVRAQTQYAASVVEEMNHMKSEMQTLKSQTRTQLDDFSVKVKSMENGINATVSEAQFRTTINYCQRQIGNMAAMLDMNEEDLTEGAGMPGLAASAAASMRRDQCGGNGNGGGDTDGAMMSSGGGDEFSASMEGGASIRSHPSASGSPTKPTATTRSGATSMSGFNSQSSASTNTYAPNATSSSGSNAPRGAVLRNNVTSTTSGPRGSSPSTNAAHAGDASPNTSRTSSSSKIGKKSRTPRDGGGEGGIRGLITKEINEWYRTRGQVDAKIRHDVTIATSKAQMQELQSDLEQTIKTAVAELVSLPYLKETLESQQAATQKNIAVLSKEQDRIRKTQSQFQARIRSNVTSTMKRVSNISMTCSKRISRFYAMMSLPEPIVPGEEGGEYDGEYDDDMASGGGGGGSQTWGSSDADTPRSSIHEGGEEAGSSATNDNNNGNGGSAGGKRHHRRNRGGGGGGGGGEDGTPYIPMGDALPFPPPPDMGRKAPKGAMTGGKPQPTSRGGARGGNDFMSRASPADSVATMVDEGSMDATTSNVIHSPVFVAFRQHVLNDISERIASARPTQSSDIDVELLALRNDIRHRVTSSRVVELIKQYSDTETPHRVTQLFRLVKELEGEKVSVLDLNDGLRSKADAHILDTKANIEYVDSIAKRLTQRLDALQADLSILIHDRKEYREVVQQLLLQTQQLRQGRPNNNAANLTSGVFPPIGGGVGVGGEGVGDLSMSTFGENGVGGGGATRTFAGGKQNHPGGLVPLTELLHARHAGGPMVGSVIHSPSPPLPLLHKPDIEGNPAVMPVTESQQGYTSAVSSEKQQRSGGGGTIGSSLTTSRSPQPPPQPQSTTTSDKKLAFSSPSMTYPVTRQSAESAAPIPFTTSKAFPPPQQSSADRAL